MTILESLLGIVDNQMILIACFFIPLFALAMYFQKGIIADRKAASKKLIQIEQIGNQFNFYKVEYPTQYITEYISTIIDSFSNVNKENLKQVSQKITPPFLEITKTSFELENTVKTFTEFSNTVISTIKNTDTETGVLLAIIIYNLLDKAKKDAEELEMYDTAKILNIKFKEINKLINETLK